MQDYVGDRAERPGESGGGTAFHSLAGSAQPGTSGGGGTAFHSLAGSAQPGTSGDEQAETPPLVSYWSVQGALCVASGEQAEAEAAPMGYPEHGASHSCGGEGAQVNGEAASMRHPEQCAWHSCGGEGEQGVGGASERIPVRSEALPGGERASEEGQSGEDEASDEGEQQWSDAGPGHDDSEAETAAVALLGAHPLFVTPNPLFDCSRRETVCSLGSPMAASAAAAAAELGSHSPAWGMEHYGSCSPMPRPAPAAVVGLGANSPAVRGMEEHYGSCSPMPRPAPAVAAAAASGRSAISLSPSEAGSRSAGGSIYPRGAHLHAGVGSAQRSSSKALDFSPCWEPSAEGGGGSGGTSGICAAMQLLDSGAYATFVITASAASKGQACGGLGEKKPGFQVGPVLAAQSGAFSEPCPGAYSEPSLGASCYPPDPSKMTDTEVLAYSHTLKASIASEVCSLVDELEAVRVQCSPANRPSQPLPLLQQPPLHGLLQDVGSTSAATTASTATTATGSPSPPTDLATALGRLKQQLRSLQSVSPLARSLVAKAVGQRSGGSDSSVEAEEGGDEQRGGGVPVPGRVSSHHRRPASPTRSTALVQQQQRQGAAQSPLSSSHTALEERQLQPAPPSGRLQPTLPATTPACPQLAPSQLTPSAMTLVFSHQQHAAAAHPSTAYRSACSTRCDAGLALFHTPVSWPFTPLSTAPRSASGPGGSGSRITAEEFAALPPAIQMFAPPSLRMGLTPVAAVEGLAAGTCHSPAT